MSEITNLIRGKRIFRFYLFSFFPVKNTENSPPPSLYSHCFHVHLGDILRYRSNPDGEQILANGYLQQANFYYKKASEILPSNGQPYNQLAILAFKQKDYFHLIYYWCKALDAKSPFLVSKTNLIRQLERLRGRPDIDVRQSLGTSAPMKKIEIAKKYSAFKKSFSTTAIWSFSDIFRIVFGKKSNFSKLPIRLALSARFIGKSF